MISEMTYDEVMALERKDMKVCPRCGNPLVRTNEVSAGIYAVCNDCGFTSASYSKTEGEAIAKWNLIPRNTVWTRTHPEKEGFYWYKKDENEPTCMVRVHESKDGLIVNVSLVLDVARNSFVPVRNLDGYWAGPIPLPVSYTEIMASKGEEWAKKEIMASKEREQAKNSK